MVFIIQNQIFLLKNYFPNFQSNFLKKYGFLKKMEQNFSRFLFHFSHFIFFIFEKEKKTLHV